MKRRASRRASRGARKGMAAIARTPVLPEANQLGPISAHLRRSRSTAIDPKATFKIGPMKGR
jgi:hypothetical protein